LIKGTPAAPKNKDGTACTSGDEEFNKQFRAYCKEDAEDKNKLYSDSTEDIRLPTYYLSTGEATGLEPLTYLCSSEKGTEYPVCPLKGKIKPYPKQGQKGKGQNGKGKG